MSRRALALGVLAAILTGCGRGEQPALQTPPATPARTAAQSPQATPAQGAAPGVRIVEPADGATLPAGAVTVRVAVTNFRVVDKLGQPPVPGEGHVHFFLDVENLPTDPTKPAIVTGPGQLYHASATTEYTWPDVKPGRHVLGVVLVNNDHRPLSPPVSAKVTVTLR